MINFISSVLGSVIRVIYNLVGQNYLISLLIFTVLTKLLLFPLMLKQLKSTEGIQRIAPEDKKLREKYKDDPQKLNQEIAKLYADNKISPMAGCLLPIIQIPIIIAMFYVVKQPLTYIAQMDQATMNTYTAQYLNVEPDQVTDKIAKQYEINIAKEYNLMDLSITSKISLGDTPKDAFSKDETKRVSKWTLTIPVLSLLFSYLSNFITTRLAKKNNTANLSEDQAEMQKSMNVMMPILSAYISFAWPLALGVYWLFGSILGIGQQFLIDKLMAKDRQQNGNDEDKKLFLGKGENND
ncbi:MAG: membrane protein insertase YidC [Clostridia bacterium]|nr:membrane protein insertase YidC [Clostridia bacterium]